MAYTKPSDLEPLREKLVEAVINAYMKREVTRDDKGEFDRADGGGSCEEGEFRYKDERTGLDTNVYVSYPDGVWKHKRTWEKDPERDPGYTQGELTLFDAVSAYAEIRTMVNEWFDPWQACSDPELLSDPIQSLANAVSQLYVVNEVRVESVQGGEADTDKKVTAPVPSVSSAVTDMGSELSSLNGEAIGALEVSYTNDVALTLSGQRGLASVAAIAVGGEAEAWYRAYQDVGTLFENATKDFNSFANATGATEGPSKGLSIVSGVTGLASLGTAAFPPASLALGAVSGLTGLAGNFFEGDEAVADVRVQIAGDSYTKMWESFTDSLTKINSQIVDAEYSLAMMCRAGLDSYYSNPNSYSITSVGRTSSTGPAPTNPQPGDDLGRFTDADQNSKNKELYLGDSIYVVHSKLKNVSAMIEHVGDHQDTVAKSLGPDLVADQWTRGYLPGGIIGWGPSGHHADYAAVVDALTDLLLEEAKTAHRVAEHAYDISTGFSRREDEVVAELDKLETDKYPA